ncbi:hypothetical protein FBALC1_14317 [Flavobacteriales bacterium ALC-1]|nr:hypothetical protein FBALC1_14317 [Flavobacteriales bacterium ALC-1]
MIAESRKENFDFIVVSFSALSYKYRLDS